MITAGSALRRSQIDTQIHQHIGFLAITVMYCASDVSRAREAPSEHFNVYFGFHLRSKISEKKWITTLMYVRLWMMATA